MEMVVVVLQESNADLETSATFWVPFTKLNTAYTKMNGVIIYRQINVYFNMSNDICLC